MIDRVTPPPLSSAERMQRTRERKRRGLLRVSLDLFSRERRVLTRFGYLDDAHLDNPAAVREGIYKLLQRFASPREW